MVDIKKDFTESFEILKNHKKIAIPIFCSLLLPIILGFLFFQLSGFSPLIKELFTTINDFDEQKTDYLLDLDNVNDNEYPEELINYIGKDSSSSNYNEELGEYLINGNYDWGRYKELLNVQNLIMLISFLFISIIGSFYFSCMSFAIIAMAFKNQDLNFDKVIEVTNNFIIRLFSMKILMFFIFMAPIILSIGIVVSLFFINTIIGVLSILLFFILIFAYLIYFGLRLFFSVPALFVDNKGASSSIKLSYNLTKGHLKQVIIIGLMIYGINVFMNSVISQPLYNSSFNLLIEISWIKNIINFMVISIFLVLESFVFTFEHIFLFRSYIDFKEIDNIIK
jgi:hypothetical protein